MDKTVKIEDAIKSIFLQCIDDRDVISELKNKVCPNNRERVAECIEESNSKFKENGIEKKVFFDETQFAAIMDGINKVLINQNNFKTQIASDKSHEQIQIAELQKKYEEDIKKIQEEKQTNLAEMQQEYNRQIKKTIEGYENKVGMLLEENKGLSNQINELAFEKDKLQNEKVSLEISNNEIKTQYENEKRKYSAFEESLYVWESLCTLNQDNRDYIECLCGSFNELSTLSLGRDDNKINQLWLCIRDIAIKENNNDEELEKLVKYFEFCLKVANSTKRISDKYVLFEIEIGNDFEMDTCIKTSDSKQMGVIKTLVMKGVKVGKDIVYKAIVRVE